MNGGGAVYFDLAPPMSNKRRTTVRGSRQDAAPLLGGRNYLMYIVYSCLLLYEPTERNAESHAQSGME